MPLWVGGLGLLSDRGGYSPPFMDRCNTSTRCRARRPVPARIWARQLKPFATMVSFGARRAQRGEEAELAHCAGSAQMLRRVPEGPRHPAAARLDQLSRSCLRLRPERHPWPRPRRRPSGGSGRESGWVCWGLARLVVATGLPGRRTVSSLSRILSPGTQATPLSQELVDKKCVFRNHARIVAGTEVEGLVPQRQQAGRFETHDGQPLPCQRREAVESAADLRTRVVEHARADVGAAAAEGMRSRVPDGVGEVGSRTEASQDRQGRSGDVGVKITNECVHECDYGLGGGCACASLSGIKCQIHASI